MEIEMVSEDKYGADSYERLFSEIMADIGKALHIEKALLVLHPDIPFFVFSIRLKAEPSNKTIADVANIRAEDNNVYLTITDERYAPDILSELWAKYGKDSVEQQTRFDMEIRGIPEKEVSGMVIASGEDDVKDIVGAVWRSMPEGIKNRHTFITGPVITVVATEEIFEPYMLNEGMKYHVQMGGKKDV